MFEKIYHDYLRHLNEENVKERYKGKESWYHASGAGFCSRKLYFESVEKVEPTNLPNKRSTRIMGLGTTIHNDIQSSLLYYNNIYNNNIDNISKDYISKNNKYNFHTEGEIVLKGLNVRGFYDVVVEDYSKSSSEPAIRLYDIKSIGAYGFKKKFSQYEIPEADRCHSLQLSTYGLGVREKFGHLDSMDLIYYNKDDSRMKKFNVPLDYLGRAESFWRVVNEEHKRGLPRFNLGSSPTKEWMCNYCQFKNHCKPPSFKQVTKSWY
tara:strand:- start:14983 stop:15777 length:795 start_codon:yes stop_codon:yes gene_type:complete